MKLFLMLFFGLIAFSNQSFAWKAAHTGDCTKAELESKDPTYMTFHGNCLKSAKAVPNVPKSDAIAFEPGTGLNPAGKVACIGANGSCSCADSAGLCGSGTSSSTNPDHIKACCLVVKPKVGIKSHK